MLAGIRCIHPVSRFQLIDVQLIPRLCNCMERGIARFDIVGIQLCRAWQGELKLQRIFHMPARSATLEDTALLLFVITSKKSYLVAIYSHCVSTGEFVTPAVNTSFVVYANHWKVVVIARPHTFVYNIHAVAIGHRVIIKLPLQLSIPIKAHYSRRTNRLSE